jgi:thiamine-monophosphate kinase
MNENSLLKSIFPLLNQGKDIVVGPGDDCAVINIENPKQYFLIAADQIISNIHFDPQITSPKDAGAKLIKRNISDIAAMGGIPSHAVVTIAAGNYNEEWIKSFYMGLTDEANKWNVSICGGDIAGLPKIPAKKTNDDSQKQSTGNEQLLVTTLTITGYVGKNKLCLRKNAKPGDLIFVTGKLGNSYNSKHHLTFTPRIKEANFIAGTYTNTMMDISDGLLIDLQRIALASNTTMQLKTDSLPSSQKALDIKNILTDGEDYELIFTVPPKKADELITKWPFKTRLTKIGTVISKKDNPDVIDQNNIDLISKFTKIGWDHIKN